MGTIVLALYGLLIIYTANRTLPSTTTCSFFVNNRATTALGIGLSIVVSCVGASATMGMIGMGFTIGTPAFWWLGMGSIGLTILSVMLAQKVRATNAYTMPQLVEQFLGKLARPLVACLVVLAWFAILAAQFVAIGKTVWALTGFSSQICLILGFLLIVGHTFGGISSVMRTDTLQTGIMVCALVMLVLWLTDHNPHWLAQTRLEAVNENFPPSKLVYFFFIVGANYLVCPTLFNRFLSAKDTQSARKGGLIAAGGLICCGVLIVSVGLACRGLVPAGTRPDDVLATALVHILPQWMNILVSVALVSTIVSSADSCLITTSTVLCHDILGITDVRANRLGIVCIACISAIVSLWGKDIIGFLFMAYDIYACGVVVPVFLSMLLSKYYRIDERFACAAILLGGVCGLVSAFSEQTYYSYTGMAIAALTILAGARKQPLKTTAAPVAPAAIDYGHQTVTKQ